MKSALLIDIGSTFTKALLVDLQQQRVMGRGRAYTTIDRDVTLGLKQALSGLSGWKQAQYRLACSSAAGGLKLVAIGLVPDLTAEAARRAALGAGSKVLQTYSYELSSQELEQLRALEPDIILLAGGTNGGNREVILNNARKLAESHLEIPIIVAGNKVVGPEAASILRQGGKQPYVTDNVMPALEELNITPARRLIREIFLENIIEAKGLDRVKEIIEGVIMPTPAAVLKAAALLAEGHDTEPGLGELLVLDIGGATTDVHSLASGNPTNTGVNWRGLEEPFQKRTVEGDLGMRYSAPGLYRAVGRDKLLNHLQKRGLELEAKELDSYIEKIHRQVDYLPDSKDEALIDRELARQAARRAVARHTGHLETVYTPRGAVSIQKGKDLSQLKTVIGTGGIIVNNREPDFILEGVLYDNQEDPQLLAPLEPKLMIDGEYMLAAAGLLSEKEPELALKFMKKHLQGVK